MSLYCGSIRNRNYDFDFKFMEENKVIRNMVDQSVLQREKKEDKLNNAVR